MTGLNRVEGNGPVPCSIMFIGEAPGETEDKKGKPFCGKSGVELDRNYLKRSARVYRENVYVTNVVKCRTNEKDRDPTVAEIAACSGLLWAELAAVQPRYLGLIGSIATRWVLGPDVRMEKVHGFGYEWLDYLVMPLYHPAYALHNTAMILHVMDDFEHFGQMVRGDESVMWRERR